MAYTSDNMLKSIDWITICIYLALVIFGWFSVCGASYDYGEIDFFSFDTRAGKQLVWISCSLGLGFILLMLEDKLYDMFAYIFYGAMMLLLLVTPFLAEDTKGSYSWIKFGPVSLQPAEFAKFATALALAKFMNVYGFTMSKLKYSLPVTGILYYSVKQVLHWSIWLFSSCCTGKECPAPFCLPGFVLWFILWLAFVLVRR